PPGRGPAAMPGRARRPDRSSEAEREEGWRGMIDEVHAPRVVEGAGVALESVGEPPVERRRVGGGARAGAVVLPTEVGRPLTLADVVASRRRALDPLAEDTGHEQREVADVAGYGHFVLRPEVLRILPDRLRLAEHGAR